MTASLPRFSRLVQALGGPWLHATCGSSPPSPKRLLLLQMPPCCCRFRRASLCSAAVVVVSLLLEQRPRGKRTFRAVIERSHHARLLVTRRFRLCRQEEHSGCLVSPTLPLSSQHPTKEEEGEEEERGAAWQMMLAVVPLSLREEGGAKEPGRIRSQRPLRPRPIGDAMPRFDGVPSRGGGCRSRLRSRAAWPPLSCNAPRS